MVIWGKPLNPRSHVQLKKFFYEVMGLPEQHHFDKGERKLTVNNKALETLREYPDAQLIVNLILATRSCSKDIGVYRSGVDRDGRMRFSLNVGATETDRWSSSKNPFGGGTNGQNITDRIRRIFTSDPGKKLINADLSQAESFATGAISGMVSLERLAPEKAWAYLRACAGGDLHTGVCKMVWPEPGMDRG